MIETIMISVNTVDGSVSLDKETLLKFPYFVNTLETMGTLEGISIPFTSEEFMGVINALFYESKHIELLEFLLVNNDTLIRYKTEDPSIYLNFSLSKINNKYTGLIYTNNVKIFPTWRDTVEYNKYHFKTMYSDIPMEEIYKDKKISYNDLLQFRYAETPVERYLKYFFQTTDENSTYCHLNNDNIQWLLDNECKDVFSKLVRLFIITGDKICLKDIPKPDKDEQLKAFNEIQNKPGTVLSEYFIEILNK